LSESHAGALQGWMQMVGAVPALVLAALPSNARDHRISALVSPALGACGLAGLALTPAWSLLWVSIFGMGMGAALILSLALLGLRAGSPAVAASLLAMCQC